MKGHISEVLKGEEYFVVVGGTRFDIESEEAPRFPRGHGGNPFIFKLKDSGKVVYSTNVWNSGSTEQPDTAEILEYKDWSSVGIADFGVLKKDANVYVFSNKVPVKQ